MNLLELLLSYGLATGAHTMGHLTEGDSRGYETSLRGLSETYDHPEVGPYFKSPEDAIAIHGAGFKGQDTLNRAINSPESNVANAIYKLSYVAGIPGLYGGMGKNGLGDIGGMERDGVKKGIVKPMLAASAMFDYLKSRFPEKLKNHNVSFGQSSTGTPMLEYTHIW